ncbi:MAG TPA: hypothetical protein VK784_03935, partial [Pseudonocardiaceae bacterium]|nr:hypothetical protein [Pseudonocardiaceae bacterium]
ARSHGELLLSISSPDRPRGFVPQARSAASGRHSGELVAVPADSPVQPRWACTRIAVPAGSAYAGIPHSPQENVHKHPCERAQVPWKVHKHPCDHARLEARR